MECDKESFWDPLVDAFGCSRSINSGYEEISEDNHQLNVSLEAEGLLWKMDSLEFGILTEFWSSVLRRVNETSHSLQSPQLY